MPMNNSSVSTFIATIALIVSVVAAGFVVMHPAETAKLAGSVTSTALNCLSGPATCYNDLNASGTFWLGGSTQGTAVGEVAARVTTGIASTTVCSITAPAATSSLEHLAFNITTGTSTAALITFATSTSPSASTSPLAGASALPYVSNSEATLTWDPGVNNDLITPGTFLNVTATAPAGGITFGGNCNALFTLDN